MLRWSVSHYAVARGMPAPRRSCLSGGPLFVDQELGRARSASLLRGFVFQQGARLLQGEDAAVDFDLILAGVVGNLVNVSDCVPFAAKRGSEKFFVKHEWSVSQGRPGPQQ